MQTKHGKEMKQLSERRPKKEAATIRTPYKNFLQLPQS